jgi:hypothetical protein
MQPKYKKANLLYEYNVFRAFSYLSRKSHGEMNNQALWYDGV